MEEVRDTPPPETFLPTFSDFVLSTCSPSHVKAARRGVNDWIAAGPDRPNVFVSPSTGQIHDCDEACQSWVLRFRDGIKVCAISGRTPGLAAAASSMVGSDSPLKRGRDKVATWAVPPMAHPNDASLRLDNDDDEDGLPLVDGGGIVIGEPLARNDDEMEWDDAEEDGEDTRMSDGTERSKRHQDRPIPGSSAALAEKFGLDLSAAAYPHLRVQLMGHLPTARTPAPTPRSPPNPNFILAQTRTNTYAGWGTCSPTLPSSSPAAAAQSSP